MAIYSLFSVFLFNTFHHPTLHVLFPDITNINNLLLVFILSQIKRNLFIAPLPEKGFLNATALSLKVGQQGLH